MPTPRLAYEAVLARGRTGSSFYAQSLYKHGWSQFKQGLNEDSLKSFADLLDLTLIDPKDSNRARAWDTLGRADRELVEDTLRVMSITFSYLDGAKSIDEFIAHRGPMPYAWLVYSRLGDLYVEKQRYQDAATTYRAFVSRDPVDEHAPAPVHGRHRGLSQGRLRRPDAGWQARVRATLWLRCAVLEGSRAQRLSAGSRGAEDQSQRRRRSTITPARRRPKSPRTTRPRRIGIAST